MHHQSRATERFSKNGNFRGHYMQGILKYQLNKIRQRRKSRASCCVKVITTLNATS